jgi:hypothetical protein
MFTALAGSPFQFMVIDPTRAIARGDGLGLVRCNQPTSFVISAPAAQSADVEVLITGYDPLLRFFVN